MAFYAVDRFGRFGIEFMTRSPLRDQIASVFSTPVPESSSAPATLTTTQPSMIERVFLNREEIFARPPAPTASSQSTPQPTAQEQADKELADLQKQQSEAEQAQVYEETLDIGAPEEEKTPWLLYAGVGVGALVLIGGALFATRKKGGNAKTAGYRKRRSRR